MVCRIKNIILFIIIVGITMICLTMFFRLGSARTITVDDDGGADFSRIQHAIDNATKGDSIKVWEGIYQESIWVNNSIDLQGNASNKTIIDGNGSMYAIRILSENVNISGLTIIHSKRAIGIESSHVQILDNYFASNNTYGIEIFRSDEIVIINNEFRDCKGSGISITESKDISVDDNYFSDNGYGVSCDRVSKASMRDNYFEYHAMGIYLDFSENIIISNNGFFNTTRSGIFILEDHCEDIQIKNNEFGENRHDVRRYGRETENNQLSDLFTFYSIIIVISMIIAVFVIFLRKEKQI